ncbi:DUF3365 domain-containing protein [bacterium]|nr:DUF3365 domain-containing protein [bacterium]
MPQPSGERNRTGLIVGYAAISAVAWTLAVGAAIAWNWHHEKEAAYAAATVDARAQFAKDVIYRRWNADHGGVYVPITAETQPNPYLSMVDNRDIETTAGQQLTLINPAYMTRQVHELGFITEHLHGHITSLNPIRPLNKPDDWERRALETLEAGGTEVTSIEPIHNELHLRFMGSLITEESCLKCHAQQGYQVGQVRGGISVSVPLSPYLLIAQGNGLRMLISYSVLWLLGLLGLFAGALWMVQQIRRLSQAEHQLREVAARSAQLDTIRQTTATLAHEINNPLTGIIANLQSAREAGAPAVLNSEILDETLRAAYRIRDAVKKLGAVQDLAFRSYTEKTNIIDIHGQPGERDMG